MCDEDCFSCRFDRFIIKQYHFQYVEVIRLLNFFEFLFDKYELKEFSNEIIYYRKDSVTFDCSCTLWGIKDNVY